MSGGASKAWTWRHAFAASDLPAMTKAVLHTLGMFMNELGEGCYPSVADIVRYSGLDKKTVLKHLGIARDAGWIAVSQHGYRGQKWKRQEYAARWPERDLISMCPTSDALEGGVAAPPPLRLSKVVESAPQGGGTEGSKVVEQLHQDKTSPDTTPVTSPDEREARAGERAEGAPADATDNPRKFEKRVKALAGRCSWPGWAESSTDWAVDRFAELSDAERAEAERCGPAYVAHCGGKALSIGNYFKQRKWLDLPEEVRNPPASTVVEAPPFGPVWGAVRMRTLVTQPPVAGPPPTPGGFQARLLAQDDAAGRRARLERQAKFGWPTVNAMHAALAERRRGVTVLIAEEALKPLMEPVLVGTPLFEAWRDFHARRGWPWLPDPGRMPVVYFPAGGPENLAAFEAAIEERGDDDSRPQAAE